MKCHVCAAEMPENTKFCSKCGTPLSDGVRPESTKPAGQQPAAPVQESKPKNPLPLKKLLIGAGAVVAVIIVIVICANVFKPAKYPNIKDVISLYNTDDGVQIMSSNGTKSTIDGTLMGTQRNLDGSVMAALIDESGSNSDDSSSSDSSSGHTLYYIANGKATVVNDDVYSFKLSASGGGLAYSSNYDGSVAELNLYSGGKSQSITSECYQDFCISPDGKTVGYNSDYDESSYDFTGYIWNGKAKSLGDNRAPVAISNGGKYVYFFKVSDDSEYPFYVRKGEDEVKLGSSVSTLYFNSDATQVIFTGSDNSYISRNGSEKKKLSGYISSMILPEGAQITYINGYGQYSIQYYGLKSFAGTFYDGGGSIERIDGSFETSSVANTANNIILCKDGKTLLYMKSDSIYKIDGMQRNAEPVELVKDDVADFKATGNGSVIYYVTNDDELLYQKGKSKPKHIADDLVISSNSGRYIMDVSDKSGAVYYVTDDELYVSNKGAKGTLIKNIDVDIDYVGAGLFFIMAYGPNDDGGYDYYRSTDGTKFEKIASTVTAY